MREHTAAALQRRAGTATCYRTEADAWGVANIRLVAWLMLSILKRSSNNASVCHVRERRIILHQTPTLPHRPSPSPAHKRLCGEHRWDPTSAATRRMMRSRSVVAPTVASHMQDTTIVTVAVTPCCQYQWRHRGTYKCRSNCTSWRGRSV